ncbi:hypothetical protein EV13_3072 [Prochlorococcus sp. MIT 0702]|nr:hypothetical protein EV13_3072 [Prochlorococcus sp. MIT 0702]KGG29214.1 hypothetical protein EV12_0265 [Prochlorococcus sp. MIT 0701]KGG30501.1 hypothetical protein EV14_3036 [Prochlorococcus sp. MIT 0703]
MPFLMSRFWLRHQRELITSAACVQYRCIMAPLSATARTS